MVIVTISLHGGQIEQEAAMQAEQVKGIGSDLTALSVTQGMTGVFDLVAVNCPNAATQQFGKARQQIGRLALTPSGVKFQTYLIEEMESAFGVQAVEERTALNHRVPDLRLLLEKISAAAGLAQRAQETHAEKVWIGNAGAVTTGANEIPSDIFHGGEELLQE